MGLEAARNIADLRAMAQRRLPKVIFDYLEGGAEDETSLRANQSAFEAVAFQPRVMGGGHVDLSVHLFGKSYSAPFLIAPTGLNGIFWKDGDLHLATAAGDAGIGFVVSTAASSSLEDVAKAGCGEKWFQLYPWGKRALSQRLVERAIAAGYEALVVTVDSLVPGKRERDMRNNFAHRVQMTPRVVADGLAHPRWLLSVWARGGMPRVENIAEFVGPQANARALADFTRQQRNPHFGWDDIAHIRRLWDGPIILKGIMHPLDVTRAIDEGLDGAIVSNHGGRQLDGAAATLEVLPSIAQAAAGRARIFVDGGVRRGADIAKALALGADAVLLGRAPLYGLAAGGKAGVAKALDLLKDELQRVMLLCGVPDCSQFSPDILTAGSKSLERYSERNCHD